MARPIGRRVKEVLAVVDELGSATAAQIHPYLATMCHQSVHKYCARAVNLGLLTVTRSGRRCTYRAASGWQDVVHKLEPVPVLSESLVAAAIKRQPNSVFALGSF